MTCDGNILTGTTYKYIVDNLDYNYIYRTLILYSAGCVIIHIFHRYNRGLQDIRMCYCTMNNRGIFIISCSLMYTNCWILGKSYRKKLRGKKFLFIAIFINIGATAAQW